MRKLNDEELLLKMRDLGLEIEKNNIVIDKVLKDLKELRLGKQDSSKVNWVRRATGGYKYKTFHCVECGCENSVCIERPQFNDLVPYCSACGSRLDDRFMHYCPNCGICLEKKK